MDGLSFYPVEISPAGERPAGGRPKGGGQRKAGGRAARGGGRAGGWRMGGGARGGRGFFLGLGIVGLGDMMDAGDHTSAAGADVGGADHAVGDVQAQGIAGGLVETDDIADFEAADVAGGHLGASEFDIGGEGDGLDGAEEFLAQSGAFAGLVFAGGLGAFKDGLEGLEGIAELESQGGFVEAQVDEGDEAGGVGGGDLDLFGGDALGGDFQGKFVDLFPSRFEFLDETVAEGAHDFHFECAEFVGGLGGGGFAIAAEEHIKEDLAHGRAEFDADGAHVGAGLEPQQVGGGGEGEHVFAVGDLFEGAELGFARDLEHGEEHGLDVFQQDLVDELKLHHPFGGEQLGLAEIVADDLDIFGGSRRFLLVDGGHFAGANGAAEGIDFGLGQLFGHGRDPIG